MPAALRLLPRLAAAALLLLAVGLCGLTAVPKLLGWSSHLVLTGSMAPAIPVGALVVVRPTPVSQLRAGDVVTFLHSQTRRLVTHRVVRLELHDDGWRLRTRGDANRVEDLWDVRGDDLAGQVTLAVPGMASLLETAASPAPRWLAAAAAAGMLLRRLSPPRSARARRPAVGLTVPA